MAIAETHPERHDRYDWQPEPSWVHLPGFVESGVTYESHEFWIEWTHSKYEDVARPTAKLWVRHGGGVESIILNTHEARALRDMLLHDMVRSAFHLCWAVFAVRREVASTERSIVSVSYMRDFANGRLKKRKIPGRAGAYVWREGQDHAKYTIAFDEQ